MNRNHCRSNRRRCRPLSLCAGSVGSAEEPHLVGAFVDLPFKEFEFQGFLGKRRVVSFGTRYDFNGGGLKAAGPMPPFLLPLRERAAAFARLAPDRLAHALVTEYRPGTSIGWHRDRPHYADVIGVSLGRPAPSACAGTAARLGTRRAAARPSLGLSVTGPSRDDWEHSIPAVAELRYSITFRSLRHFAP